MSTKTTFYFMNIWYNKTLHIPKYIHQSIKIQVRWVFVLFCFSILYSGEICAQDSPLNSTAEQELSTYFSLFYTIPSNEENIALQRYDSIGVAIDKDLEIEKISLKQANMLRVRCNLTLARWYFDQSNTKQAIFYYTTALSLLEGTGGTKEESLILSGLLSAYHQIGQRDSTNNVFEKVLRHHKVTTEPMARSINLMTFGVYYGIQGRTDTSIVLFEKSLDLLTKENSVLWRAYCIRGVAGDVHKLGEVEKAFKYLELSLELFGQFNAKLEEVETLIMIGALYAVQFKPKIALQYYDRAELLNEKWGNHVMEAKIYQRKAELYSTQGNCTKSLEYHKKTLKLVIQDNMSPWVASMCISDISAQYLCLGDYDQAHAYIDRVLNNGQAGYPTFHARNLFRKGNIYHTQGKQALASKYFKEALGIYQKIKHVINAERVSKKLASALNKQGKYEEAYEFLMLSNNLKDSLTESKIEKIIVEKDKKLALEQERQKAALQQEEIRNLEQEQTTERYIFIACVLVFLFVLLTIYLGVKNYKQRKEQAEVVANNKIKLYQKEMDLLQIQINALLDTKKKVVQQPLELDYLNHYLQTPLTSRELDVLTQLTLGKSNVEIGKVLFISVNTVGTHLKNIYSKLDVNNRVQAVKFATQFTEQNESKQEVVA